MDDDGSSRGPPRVTEGEIRRLQRQRLAAGAKGAAAEVPTTVLSLWQPLASFLAHGIQRVEGRGWSTEFRGPLWIHAGSKQVTSEDISHWEGIYRDVHVGDGNRDLKMPQSYPTSALVGLVELVDVVSNEDFNSWPVPRELRGLRLEGRSHGRGSLFLVEGHQRLVVPLKMSGQHKLWRLDHKTAATAFRGLLPNEQIPAIRFLPIRDLARAGGTREDTDGEDGDSFREAAEEFMLEAALAASLADSILPVGENPSPAAASEKEGASLGGNASPERRSRWRSQAAGSGGEVATIAGPAQEADEPPNSASASERQGRWRRRADQRRSDC